LKCSRELIWVKMTSYDSKTVMAARPINRLGFFARVHTFFK
jgi:hypothetical protein